MIKLISRKRDTGVALTTLGFGTGNYNDHLMEQEQLADAGNGSYAYIDTLGEARKVLVDEMQATLLTIASDVKIQVEFNPAVVSEYRLIGYSNRTLANEDFNNDRVDAGEIGAGHTVTALYEIALSGDGGERYSPSRYDQSDKSATNNTRFDPRSSEIAQVSLRYKLPAATQSQLITHVVNRGDPEHPAPLSDDFLFSASIAAFGQLLQGDDQLTTDRDDAQLMRAYANGDATAFEPLYARHKQALFRYVRNSCDNEAVAYELYQDIWLHVIKGRSTYHAESRFNAWLYRIARNRLIDHYRMRISVMMTETAGHDHRNTQMLTIRI